MEHLSIGFLKILDDGYAPSPETSQAPVLLLHQYEQNDILTGVEPALPMLQYLIRWNRSAPVTLQNASFRDDSPILVQDNLELS
jgi:hypothetical protein